MRLLSTKSAANARKVYETYGSWKAAKAAGSRRADGVIVLPKEPDDLKPKKKTAEQDS